MQRISSKDNSLIKNIKRLKEKKYRDEYGEFIVEGLKVINEAIQEHADIRHIVVCDGCDNSEMIESHLKYEMARLDFIYVPQNIFKMLSDVETPQGVLAVIGKIKTNNESVSNAMKNNVDDAKHYSDKDKSGEVKVSNKKEDNRETNVSNKKEDNKEAGQTSKTSSIDLNEDIILALDDIQDPGNLGTILRTADSVGLKQILVSKGTADAYNPKVVRSTMGAIFRVNVIECENLKETLKELQNKDYKVMTTSLKAKKSIYEVDYKKKIVVIGNEANGVSKEILNIADEKVIIPMLGKTESLNASVATGVILYEYVRQKIINKKEIAKFENNIKIN